MFYNRYDYEEQEKAAAFRKSIETCMFRLQTSYKQLYYVNGRQLMGSVRGLSSDGLHPSDTGHTMIARSLSEFMKAHAI